MNRQGLMQAVLQGSTVVDRLGVKYQLDVDGYLMRKLHLKPWEEIDYNVIKKDYDGFKVICFETLKNGEEIVFTEKGVLPYPSPEDLQHMSNYFQAFDADADHCPEIGEAR